jgi:hypothetical protein
MHRIQPLRPQVNSVLIKIVGKREAIIGLQKDCGCSIDSLPKENKTLIPCSSNSCHFTLSANLAPIAKARIS